MLCQLKSCRHCNGDLVLDGEEWRCWQCGRYLYPKPPQMEQEKGDHRKRRGSCWAGDHTGINVMFDAMKRRDEEWWDRNRELIQYLDQGRPVQEISLLVGRSERQVRVVREQLNDLRALGVA